MTTYHVYGSLTLRKALDVAGGGDIIDCHNDYKLYTDPLDLHSQRMQGGDSWTRKLTLRAHKKPDGTRDKVVFMPGHDGGATHVLWAVKRMNRFIEFDGIELDGTHCSKGVMNISYVGTDPTAVGESARYFRFKNCIIRYGYLSNVFNSSVLAEAEVKLGRYVVELDNCDLFGAGAYRPLEEGDSHAVYSAGGGALVSKSRVWQCTGTGVCFYNNGQVPLRSRLEWSQVKDCLRDGVLLAGISDECEGNTIWKNQNGLHIWPTARGWKEKSNTIEYNTHHQVYVDPQAIP